MGRQQFQSLAEFVSGLNLKLSPAVVEVVTEDLVKTLAKWNPYFNEEKFRTVAAHLRRQRENLRSAGRRDEVLRCRDSRTSK